MVPAPVWQVPKDIVEAAAVRAERAALAARLREMVATRPDEPRCPVCEMIHHTRSCIVPELLRLADELEHKK